MAGNLRERPPGSGHWELRVSAGRDPSNPARYLYVTRTFHGSKAKASKALAALVTEVEQGQHKTAAATFGKLLDEWLAVAETKLSATTINTYRVIVAKHLKPALGDIRLGKLSAHHFDRLYVAMGQPSTVAGKTIPGRAPATIRQTHAVARRAMEQARKWGWVERNVVADAEPPPLRRSEVVPPSSAQLAGIIAKAVERAAESRLERDRDHAVMMLVAAGTGCRRGELCGLRWRDVLEVDGAPAVRVHRSVVDISGRIAEKDTKTHAVRVVPLDDLTAGVLVGHRKAMLERADEWNVALADDAFVFARTPDGAAPMRPEGLSKAFKRACRAAGVSEDVHLHDLRHLNASEQLARGVPVHEVAKRLGHSTATMTLNIYGHVLPGARPLAPDALGAALGPAAAALNPAPPDEPLDVLEVEPDEDAAA